MIPEAATRPVYGFFTERPAEDKDIDTLHTMLVVNDSPIQTFGDVVVSYLVENDIDKRSFEAEALRLLLLEAGFPSVMN